MDLRQLRYFSVLAAHQHFGRAAAVLHIAQPALSRQIQLLESELGVRLVERHSRGASLTSEGELLLERATFLLRYTDQIKVDIMDMQATPRGPVALGLPPALASVMVPPLARVLRERYPAVRLRVVESFSPALCDGLEQGAVDVAVLSGPIAARPLIHTEPLLAERICAIARADDARLPAGSVSVSELQSVPLILAGLEKSGVRLALERATAAVDVQLNGVVEVESATVAAQLVRDGLGWTVHFASAVQREIATGELRAVPIEGLVLARYLAHAVTRPPSTATVSLMTVVCETAQSLIESGRWPMAEMGAKAGEGEAGQQ
ncbi:LysR family transcriptional regulator [Trinickia diaoshuihuensis]|uniref:LysR family transcriptional regulator n=1 Tax=Trinickia diaoshuihuensis TaxID=2292265 RepID=UPI000E267EE8|nr:LysR substrate-binding domain-containing protein [Trinickia diaoshuihuensis]